MNGALGSSGCAATGKAWKDEGWKALDRGGGVDLAGVRVGSGIGEGIEAGIDGGGGTGVVAVNRSGDLERKEDWE